MEYFDHREVENGILVRENFTNRINFNEDDNGNIFPLKKLTTLKTDDFIERISKRFSDTPEDYIYPRNTRFVKRINYSDIFVIEWEPSIRTIKVEKDMYLEYHEIIKSGRDHIIKEGDYDKYSSFQKFTLSFPYLVWIVVASKHEVTHLKLYFRLSPISNLKDLLILPPLLNISAVKNPGEDSYKEVNTVCLGGNENNPDANSDILGIEDQLNLFFTNHFNKDYPDLYDHYRNFEDSTFSNYFLWQHMTRTDPLFIFRDKFKLAKSNLKQELDSFIRSQSSNISKSNYGLFKEFSTYDSSVERNDDGDRIKLIKDNTSIEELNIHDHIVSVGDDIKVNKKVGYLNSIVKSNADYSTSLEVEYEDGNSEIVELTEKVAYEISDYFDSIKDRRDRLNEVVNFNNKIRLGDFVRVKNDIRHDNKFRRVLEIIKSHDGFIEVKLGGSIEFRTTNCVEFEKFTYNKICQILGGKVKPGCMVERKTNNEVNFNPYVISNMLIINKLKSLTTIDNNLVLNLDDGKYSDFDNFKISNDDNFKIINDVVGRTGLRLFCNSKSVEDGFIRYRRNSILGNSTRYTLYTFEKIEVLRSILKESELYVQGTDYNINFKIGDEVVISDWDNIDEMLKIKEIIGFELSTRNSNNSYIIDEDNNIDDIPDDTLNNIKYVNIKVIDENENISSHKYIHFTNVKNANILVPKIRKISRSYNDFSVGDVVKSKIPKIEGFPKKDCNRIIAFIDDEGSEYPLALMSNTWTIRCNDLEEYFYKINPDDINEVSPIRPIKIDHFKGDTQIYEHKEIPDWYIIKINKGSDPYIIFNNTPYKPSGSEFVKKPFGFLNPKFDTLFEEIKDDIHYHFPNFRNWYVHT